MGSQVLVPFRGSEDSHRHLKLMGDLGQVAKHYILLMYRVTPASLDSFVRKEHKYKIVPCVFATVMYCLF